MAFRRYVSCFVVFSLNAIVLLWVIGPNEKLSIANTEPELGTCCIPAHNAGLPEVWCEIDPVEEDCMPGNGISCNGIADERLVDGECVQCALNKACVTDILGVPVQEQVLWERFTAQCHDLHDCECVISSFEPPVFFLTWVDSCKYVSSPARRYE
jgi:hypothetical protein